jgi:hypothetical protein
MKTFPFHRFIILGAFCSLMVTTAPAAPGLSPENREILRSGDDQALLRALEGGLSPQARDARGNTPLLLAAVYRQLTGFLGVGPEQVIEPEFIATLFTLQSGFSGYFGVAFFGCKGSGPIGRSNESPGFGGTGTEFEIKVRVDDGRKSGPTTAFLA